MIKLRELETVKELSESRLSRTLDVISDRLSGIESQLSEIVRLEERVNSHDHVLSRYGSRLDNHDTRIRESELWQANFGDKSFVERLISNVQGDVTALKKKIDDLEAKKDVYTGQKDVSKEVLKWLVGVIGAILIYKITRG
jgi:DNA repair exonuclease SbcCD ATPase subunit